MNLKLLRNQLVPALLNCPCMQTRDSRLDVCNQLPLWKNDINHRDDNYADVLNIILTCANHRDGIDELIDIIETFDYQTLSISEVHKAWQYIKDISGLNNKRLIELLEIIMDVQIKEALFREVCNGLRREYESIPPIITLSPLWSIALKLWDIPSTPNKIHPLQVFVEHLAYHLNTFCHQADIAVALQNWNDKNAVGFNTPLEDIQCRRERIQSGQDYIFAGSVISLLVVLEPDPSNFSHLKRFKFRIYLWSASDAYTKPINKLVYTENRFSGWDELTKCLINEARNLPYPPAILANLRLEFFMPLHYMFSEAVDQLQYEDIFGGIRKIGADYQVVVRSLERAQDPRAQPTWISLWKIICDFGFQTGLPLDNHIIHLNDPKRIFNGLKSANIAAWVWVVPTDECGEICLDHIREILSAGTPIALWYRPCDHTDLPQAIEVLLPTLNLSDLPNFVQQERQLAELPASPGNNITLLWDDPRRIPTDLSPSISTRFKSP